MLVWRFGGCKLTMRRSCLPSSQIQWWHWAGFLTLIVFFLALDLGVFHRKAHVVQFREALAWTAIWFTAGDVLCGLPGLAAGTVRRRPEFVTGYIIELSLSMDNVFVDRAHLRLLPGAQRSTSTACCSGASSARW